jgi:exopolysaccharide biosynthesis polyprenyl glycosylphosphotransferase
VKRTMDLVFSGIGIILLSPLLIMVAVIIKLVSPGPVFYRQKRIGVNGRRFVFLKFRSMHAKAASQLAGLMSKNEMSGPVFKIKNDPRIYPFGRFLRKFSIDELPQLFNVFFGQMSLVGPRPSVFREVKQYEPWQRRRLSLRPGITCLWQVNGRNEIAFSEWMNLDLRYIDNWSLWLDFKILIKTIPVVFSGKNAY